MKSQHNKFNMTQLIRTSGVYTFVLWLSFLHWTAANFTQYEEFLTHLSKNQTFMQKFEDQANQFQTSKPQLLSAKLSCPKSLTTTETTSVHQLSPRHIKVVAALGDSLTAGNGIKARTVLGVLLQFRGLSWSVGGDGTLAEHTTLPNILKTYNPDLVGYSLNYGKVTNRDSHLNVAEPGDKAKDMPRQARRLVKRLREDKNIDYANDWKVITLFIGGNDLCDYCEDREQYSVENYVRHIREALDIINAEVPRAFVNLVQVLDVRIAKSLNRGLVCTVLHAFLCRCGAFPLGQKRSDELYAETKKYRQGLNKLVASGRYDSRDDFTVVIQPFYRDTKLPVKEDSNEPDLSYFAPDCFHQSEKGQAAAAVSLWNNMIEPVGSKSTTWEVSDGIRCPDQNYPYFYTAKNSDMHTRGKQGLLQNQASRYPTLVFQGGATLVGIAVGAVCCVLIVIAGAIYGWKRYTSRTEHEQKQLLPARTTVCRTYTSSVA